MKNNYKNGALLMIILSTAGCRKDTPIPIVQPPLINNGCEEDTCYDFPQEPELGFFFTSSGPQFIAPCFNPKNENEFVYLRTGTSPNAELVKFNLITDEEQILCSSIPIATQPQWGRQGWIVFSTTGWTVWKIKDDGTQLTELTNGVNDQYPIFNYEGSKVTYARLKNYSNAELSANPSLYAEYKMMVIDLNSNVLDSVMASDILAGNYYQKWDLADMDINGLTYFVGGSGLSAGIYILNADLDSIFSNSVTSLYPNYGWVRDIGYANGHIYYSKWRNGFYKTNITTGIESTIRIGCDLRYYDHFSISSDGKKILLERVKSDVLNEGQVIDEQHQILLMYTDSCDMKIILG